jgi:cell division protein FtsZ
MRNGGVAILGNAEAAGENRAQKAIEEAMNSPLLNDSDIRGAKWILINITSAAGENEFTMDEVEVIQNYLLTQAGENTDVILGMGYDSNLGNKLGITLIATGFEHKDPFAKPVPKREEPKPEEKIVMVLGQTQEENKQVTVDPMAGAGESAKAIEREMDIMEASLKMGDEDHLMPKLVEEYPSAPVIDMTDMKDQEPDTVHFILQPAREENILHDAEQTKEEKLLSNTTAKIAGTTTVSKLSIAEKSDSINSTTLPPVTGTPSVTPSIKETDAELIYSIKESRPAPIAGSGGYLARPSNIYAESKTEEITSMRSVEKPVPSTIAASDEQEELLDLQMQLVERDDIPAADMPLAHQAHEPLSTEVEDPALRDETEEQKRRAAERLHKLRNLSFNVNAADPNNEFETVPAYIRRNMELYNNNTQVENFYSSYEVKTDPDNQSQISSINTFLDGKKPD